MDEFKKYLQNNLDQLDVDVPGDAVWMNIEKEFAPVKRSVIPMMIKWAAAACIILLAGVGVYSLLFKSQPVSDKTLVKIETPAVNKNLPQTQEQKVDDQAITQPASIAKIKKATSHRISNNTLAKTTPNKTKSRFNKQRVPIDPMMAEFNQMESSYASMVNMQLRKVKSTPIYAEDGNYFHIFKKQFQDLANDEAEVKAEMKRIGVTDELVQRMINIYQQKITLLKQLQFEINKMNNRVKKTGADVQKQTPTYINL